MARQFNGKYEMNPNGVVNEIISEKGNFFMALREVRWSSDKDFKLDIRNYESTEEKDIPYKGIAFTDEEADELTRVFIEKGFGDDKTIAETLLEHRPNLCDHLRCVEGADFNYDEDARTKLFEIRNKDIELDDDSEGYYDPEELI